MDFNHPDSSEPPSKWLRLDSAVPNNGAEGDSWGDLVRFSNELPDELADNAFSAQNVFSDPPPGILTRDHQLPQQLSVSTAMPVLSSAAATSSAVASLPQSSASAPSRAMRGSVTLTADIKHSRAILSRQVQRNRLLLFQQQLQRQQPQQQQPQQQQPQQQQPQQQQPQQQQPQQQQPQQQQNEQLMLQQRLQLQQPQRRQPQRRQPQQQQQQQQPPTVNETCKMVQQQLVLLLHAHKCQRREVVNGVAPQPCPLPRCQTMKNVLKHMRGCVPGRACAVPYCAASRKIITHFKDCSRTDCAICRPLKNCHDRPGAALSANAQTHVFALHQSLQQRPSNLGLTPTGQQQQQAVTNVPGQQSLASSSAIPLLAPGVDANRWGLPTSTSTTPLLDAGAQQQHRSTATQQILNAPVNLELSTPGIWSRNTFTVETPNCPVKRWHCIITQDQRQRLVRKIVQSMYPSSDPATLLDKRIMSLVQYARKVEEHYYKMADSLGEYFRLITEKISKIRNNLKDKLSKRLEQGKSLVQKMKILRQAFQALQPQLGYCPIEVSREEIFEDSYRQVTKLKPTDLQKRLMVKFRGEEGLDYGGIAREWLSLLSHKMLDPDYGLFQYSRDDIYTLQINPDSGINPEHLSYFHFVGRIIGVAIFHGHYLDGGFTMPFYKQLLGKPITLDDLESVDPDLHRSLVWILNNDITGSNDHDFCVDHEAYGERIVHDLKPGGRNIPVTQENKEEYVELYVNWRLMRGIEAQFLALQEGLCELIPLNLLWPFDERELELMIVGLGKIDVQDWKENTRLENCSPDTNIVKWFWRAVEEFDEERRARLLQFVTGSLRVPFQGFKALQGSTGSQEPRLFTIQKVDTNTDNLPKAHTCFSRIEIPPYESYEKLLDKLTCAVEETCGFTIE